MLRIGQIARGLHVHLADVYMAMQDVVYQFIELFFRSETMQQYCAMWLILLKKILLGAWRCVACVLVKHEALMPTSTN